MILSKYLCVLLIHSRLNFVLRIHCWIAFSQRHKNKYSLKMSLKFCFLTVAGFSLTKVRFLSLTTDQNEYRQLYCV